VIFVAFLSFVNEGEKRRKTARKRKLFFPITSGFRPISPDEKNNMIAGLYLDS